MWQPRDGSNPYGRPSLGGNWHAIWHKLHEPCPTCGATQKRLKIEKDKATIFCGAPHKT